MSNNRKKKKMAKMVRLSDIAEKLEISTVSVSKALSNQKGVSEELRLKIREVADEMGYIPISTMKKKNSDKNFNIGVLLPNKFLDQYDSFYWQLYQKIATEVVKKDSFSMLEVIDEKDEQTLHLPKLLSEDKVDGLILLGSPINGYAKMIQKKSKVPVVYLDFVEPEVEEDSVISDGYNGTYKMTNYLFSLGHKKIAYVGTLLATGSITDRYFGYCKSLLEHDVEVRKEWILPDRTLGKDSDLDEVIKVPENMPTGFVCNCDLSAAILIKKLREKGFKVPEEISVTGFDNYLYPGLSKEEITTINVDKEKMAKYTINMLIKKMKNPEYHYGVRVVPGELIVRKTTQEIEENS